METIEISDVAVRSVTPLVSVGMLAYRHEKYIAQAIESVIAQQCTFPFELIIGEDCSPDETRHVALKYQRRYPHIIRILTASENVGMQANSVRCLQAARGEFMAYCEGDDYWCDQTKLARQVATLRRYPESVLVFHSALTIDAASGKQGITGRWSPYSRMMGANEVVLGDGGLMPTASIMLRRHPTLSLQPAWVDRAVVPDYALALWALCVGRIAYIDRTMSVYRTNVAASWSSRHVAELSYRMRHAQRIEEMFASFLEKDGSQYRDAANQMVSKYYADAIIRHPADRHDAMVFYREFADRMMGSDRLFAWLAARYGLRLYRVKSLLRKCRTALRLLTSMATNKHIET